MILKLLLILIGSISLFLGVLGVIVPGLPTTPFILLSATLYLKSSKRLYSWLKAHKYFGKIIYQFGNGKNFTLKSKLISILFMWIMISCSSIFFIKINIIKLILLPVGFLGTFCIVFFPFYKKKR